MTSPVLSTTQASPASDDACSAAGAVRRHRVLGGVLESALPLPELPAAGDEPVDWVLAVSPDQPAPVAEIVVGHESIDGGNVTLSRIDAGFRLRYEDTGCFDVSGDGRHVTWYERPDADAELVRVDVCGRVLALALHAAGDVSLHASAVQAGAAALAFVAPKAHGKSSLAAALLRRGAALLTDDTLPVTPGEQPIARPGVHQLRLNEDSAVALLDGADRPRTARGGKLVVDHSAVTRRADRPVPLAALYELQPVRELPDGRRVARQRVATTQAVIALMRHVRPAALLGGSEAGRVLARVAAIASRVPVYRLAVAAGLEHIDEVAAEVLAWHADGAAA